MSLYGLLPTSVAPALLKITPLVPHLARLLGLVRLPDSRILVFLGPLCPLGTLDGRLVLQKFLFVSSFVFTKRLILNCFFFISTTLSVVSLFFLLCFEFLLLLYLEQRLPGLDHVTHQNGLEVELFYANLAENIVLAV